MTSIAPFGEYLSNARRERGYSIREVARRIGVEPSAVSRLEDGTRGTLPHPDLFIGLVRELGLHWATALHYVPPYERLWTAMTALAFKELGANLAEHVNA
jgi:transcriptional regulator with XRE-family HTH domain